VPERATRERSEKSAEVVIAARDCSEGSNAEESETTVVLEGKRPQMSRQLELPLDRMGEAQSVGPSEEAPTATGGNERSRASGLMDKVCERRNLQAALKRVKKNKGSPGIDGMTVDELPDYLRAHWPTLRERLRTPVAVACERAA